jgi:hypothetical protein
VNFRSRIFGRSLLCEPRRKSPLVDDSPSFSCCCNIDNNFDEIDSTFTNDGDLMRLMAKTAVEQIPAYTGGVVTVDTTRIYLAGHSNGCINSLSTAALHSDMVAAVCCHAGVSITPFAEDYSAVPVWLAFGGKDFEFPPTEFPPASRVLSSYGDKNGCDATETVLPVSVNGAEVGTVTTRSNCDNGADVSFLALPDSGHSPYLNSSEDSVSASVTTLDTSKMAWEFCSRFSKSEAPDLSANINFLARPVTASPTTAPESASPTAAPESAAVAVAPKRMTDVITIVSVIVASLVFM